MALAYIRLVRLLHPETWPCLIFNLLASFILKLDLAIHLVCSSPSSRSLALPNIQPARLRHPKLADWYGTSALYLEQIYGHPKFVDCTSAWHLVISVCSSEAMFEAISLLILKLAIDLLSAYSDWTRSPLSWSNTLVVFYLLYLRVELLSSPKPCHLSPSNCSLSENKVVAFLVQAFIISSSDTS